MNLRVYMRAARNSPLQMVWSQVAATGGTLSSVVVPVDSPEAGAEASAMITLPGGGSADIHFTGRIKPLRHYTRACLQTRDGGVHSLV